MKTQTLVLLLATLSGCALDMYGTGPIPSDSASASASASPRDDAAPIVGSSDDAGPLLFTAHMPDAGTDVEDPPTSPSLGDAADQYMGCPPPFKVNPVPGGAHCTL